MTISVYTLFSTDTAASILATGLAVAEVAGLPVSTWRVGDPTRTLFRFVAEVLGARETLQEAFIKSGFLSTAEGSWLSLVAAEVYGVTREAATYASPTVTLDNSGGGGLYAREAGEITFKSSTSGKTYSSTEAVTISPGAVVTVDVQADEAGSDSAAGTDEIDEIVTTLLGVSLTASTAATAQDAQEDESLREQCRATLGALSPNGPSDAYDYVARNSDLTGSTEVTRSTTVSDSSTGTVQQYVAGSSGAVSGAAVTAVASAVATWAKPLCITHSVASASNVVVDVVASVSGVNVPSTIEDDSETAIATLLRSCRIAGEDDDVVLTTSAVQATIHALLVAADSDNATEGVVTLTSPAADVELDGGEVATLGSVTVTEV